MMAQHLTVKWTKSPIALRKCKHSTTPHGTKDSFKLAKSTDDRRIPKTYGIYVFAKIPYADKKKIIPLYIGKAKDVYKRVINQHFKHTSKHSVKLLKEIVADKKQGRIVLLVGEIQGKIGKNTIRLVERALIARFVDSHPNGTLINKQHSDVECHRISLTGNTTTYSVFGNEIRVPIP